MATTKILKIFAVLLLLFIWVYPLFYFPTLPDIIPVHFGIDGTPDGFGKKNMVWFLAGVSTAMFILLSYVSANPESPLLNMSESFKKNTKLVKLFLSVFSCNVMLLFVYIMYQTIQSALGNQQNILVPISLLFGFMILTLVGFSVYHHKTAKK